MIYKVSKTRTIIFSIVIILSIIANSVLAFVPNRWCNETNEVETRTIEIQDINIKYEDQLSLFNNYEIKEDIDFPSFEGITDYDSESDNYFDNVSLDDYSLEELQVKYYCTFDMENLIYYFTISLIDYDNNVIESETQATQAFVTENGGLDAYIDIDGEEYLLSELVTESQIDNCGLIGRLIKNVVRTVVIVAITYHIVTEIAEQIKSKENYIYNMQLDDTKDGMYKNRYITDQYARTIDYNLFIVYPNYTFLNPLTNKRENFAAQIINKVYYYNDSAHSKYFDSGYDGGRAGNYKFGFTRFENVGCEVASVYNLLIARGIPTSLATIIYLFEQKAIEFAFAWGTFGSNPLQISTILDYCNISYDKYTNYDKFKENYDASSNKYAIMSRWNAELDDGCHTFMIKQVTAAIIRLDDKNVPEPIPFSNQTYYGYNCGFYVDEEEANKNNVSSSLDYYNSGLFFIVGYLIK